MKRALADLVENSAPKREMNLSKHRTYTPVSGCRQDLFQLGGDKFPQKIQPAFAVFKERIPCSITRIALHAGVSGRRESANIRVDAHGARSRSPELHQFQSST